MATRSSVFAWKNPMDRGAWWATAHGVTGSDKTERLTAQHGGVGVGTSTWGWALDPLKGQLNLLVHQS